MAKKQFVLSQRDRNRIQDLLRPETHPQRHRRRNEIPPIPSEIVRVKNVTTSALEPGFVKLAGLNLDYGYHNGELPDSEELGLTPLGAGQLAIILNKIEPEKIGIGHLAITRAWPVEIYSDAENIAVGDPVGSKDGSNKAMIGGPFRAAALETKNGKDYVYVRRDD